VVALLVILNAIYSVVSLVVFFFSYLIVQSLLMGDNPANQHIYQSLIVRFFLIAFTLPSLLNWYFIYQQKYQTPWYLFLIPCAVVLFVGVWFGINSYFLNK
jgi:hypothetical protein